VGNDRVGLEISDVNAWYLAHGRLTAEKLGRGDAWLDTGTPSSLLRVARFVETVEDRPSRRAACRGSEEPPLPDHRP
jgi:dTDP-glucose pyrophosphorylase